MLASTTDIAMPALAPAESCIDSGDAWDGLLVSPGADSDDSLPLEADTGDFESADV